MGFSKSGLTSKVAKSSTAAGGLLMAWLAGWWSWRTVADLADSNAIIPGRFLARSSVQLSCQVASGHNSHTSSGRLGGLDLADLADLADCAWADLADLADSDWRTWRTLADSAGLWRTWRTWR
eukprot:gene9054-biopygen2474